MRGRRRGQTRPGQAMTGRTGPGRTRPGRTLALGAAALLGLAGCFSDPEIDTGLAPALTAVISGDALVLIPLAEPHPVVLLLYAIGGDGVPASVPTNVTVIPENALSQSEDAQGNAIRSGRFTFPQVPAGTYIVQGLVDVDENFNILVPQLSVPTAADLLGAYVDPSNGAYILIDVEEGEEAGEVNVIFAQPPAGAGG